MPRFRFTPGERHIFRKRPYVPLSDWAASNLIVKDGPYSGARYRKDVNPYLVEIMDTWSLPGVEEVDVSGSAQTGKTLVMHAALAYSVDRRPGPRMLAMQDDDALGKVVANKLLPMFKASPATRSELRKIRAGRISFRDSTALFLASAQSPSQRASISIQDLMLDEEALYKQIAGQGVPVAEFLERTRSYSRTRKVLRVSKPIGGDECSIVQALEECDEVRHFEARCPACMKYNRLEEAGLVLAEKCSDPKEVERRKLARYKCARCNYPWTDYLRDRAVGMGRWVADEPVPRPRKVGFYLPAILSKNVSLSEIMAEKMRAEASDAPAVKHQYVNGMWALPYRAVEMETQEDRILDRVDLDLPARTVPGDAVALTAGVDVQKRGFWYCVYAWRPDLSSALIDYGRLPDWDAVHALLHETRYEFEADSPRAGESLGIWRAGMDSGGTRTREDVVSRTEEVYNYVRRHGAGKVFACKGASHESHTPVRATSIDRLPSSRIRIPGGLWLYLLDTHYFKSLIFARLEPDARQPLTLHRETDQSFAAQISAEALVRDRNGKLAWVRKNRNNHYLDCTVMAGACVDGAWLPSFQMIVERERAAAAEARQIRPPAPDAHAVDPRPAMAARPPLPPRVLPGREGLQRNRPGFLRGRGEY